MKPVCARLISQILRLSHFWKGRKSRRPTVTFERVLRYFKARRYGLCVDAASDHLGPRQAAATDRELPG
jgi:hypothetical protein